MKKIIIGLLFLCNCSASTFFGGKLKSKVFQREMGGQKIECAKVEGWIPDDLTEDLKITSSCWCTPGVRVIEKTVVRVWILAQPQYCEEFEL